MSMEKSCPKLKRSAGKERDEASAAADFSCGNRDGERKAAHRRGRGEAIAQAEVVCGAKRLLAAADSLIAPDAENGRRTFRQIFFRIFIPAGKEKSGGLPSYFPAIPGFYSGAEAVYKALQEEVRLGKLQAGITICPGISSLSYLAARR